jgi:uncharacterized protein (TIGR00369 family)
MTTPTTREQLEAYNATSLFKTVLKGEIDEFGAGKCRLKAFPGAGVRQFLGAVHGGILGAIADDAAAWACASIAGELVTASYAIDIVAPAMGPILVAEGEALKIGRTLCAGRSSVFSADGNKRTLVALFQGTFMRIEPRQ